MARFNSVNSTGSVAGGNTISTPASGLLTTLTGTGTVTLPNPVLYAGSTQTFYNSTGSAITLSTPSGAFTGPGTGGASTLSLPASSILTVVSDGTNYIAQAWLGGNLTTNGTATFNGTIAANPTNLSVSIQPTGTGVLTLSSGTTGSLDNINVGATTQGTGKFSTLIATGTLSTTATTVATLGTTGTGALQVAGGASVAGIFNVGGETYLAGNVGIGTTPNKKLEVLSVGEIIRATSTTAANDQLISIKNNSGTADTSTNIFFADRYAASSYASSYIRGTSSGASALIFATGGTNFTNIYDAGAPTERMRINAAGAVGVGNAPFQYGASTSVGAELSIQSSNTTNAALTVQAGLSRYWIATPFGSNQLQIGGNGGSMPAAGVINITSGGNVGIGNTNPGATLDMGTRTDAIILPVGTSAQRPTGVNGMMRKNSSTGYVEYWDPASSSWLGIGAFAATGGDTVNTYTSGPNTYKYHQFTNSGSFQVLAGAKSIEYMIIGGGGGGGTLGGGGGAGGYVTGTFTASVGTYSIVIGAGANGGAQGVSGGTGTNTTALGLTAFGGGGGGSHTGGATSVAGTNGGSGGGSGDNAGSYPYGTGTAGQGNRGGNGSSVYSNTPRGGGGGGGAGGVGFDISVPSSAAGGAGGPGVLNAINGTSYYWAGGGGYGGYSTGARGGDGGIGGGGGGSCADNASPAGSGGGSALNNGTAGTAANNVVGGLGGQNTGGGGGGNGWSFNATGGRSGGSGIVIIRYTV